jgi:hypothetical protein
MYCEVSETKRQCASSLALSAQLDDEPRDSANGTDCERGYDCPTSWDDHSEELVITSHTNICATLLRSSPRNTMSPQFAQLDSLVSLISSSVEIVKAEYAKKGQIIPSLDSAEPYPPDSEQPTLELKRAVQTLEGACAQLTNTVAPPAHTMINVRPAIQVVRMYQQLSRRV